MQVSAAESRRAISPRVDGPRPVALHDDLDPGIRQDLGSVDAVSVSLVFLRSAEPLENISRCISYDDCPPRVTDVSRESGKDGSAGCASPHGLEEARDEMSLVRVMDGGDVELELLRQADQTVRLRWRSGANREGEETTVH